MDRHPENSQAGTIRNVLRWIMPVAYLAVGSLLIMEDYLGHPLLSSSLGAVWIAYGIYRLAKLWRARTEDAFSWVLVSSLALSLTLSSCSNEKGPKLDTPTSGTIRVVADESYQPIIDAEVTVFDSLYKNAEVKMTYLPMGLALEQLLADSFQIAILPRRLSDAELEPFHARGFKPTITMIARDGLALIVHPSNPDSSLTVDQVRQMLSGEITEWGQLSTGNRLGRINIVFDHARSGAVEYAVDSICGGKPLSPEYASATKSSAEVIRYVAGHPGALGILGVNWISDMDDPQAQDFLRDVRVVGVAEKQGGEPFQPYQAYLATKQYPFLRDVCIVNAQARPGLGLGLASFIASTRGQRIVLKSGLLPATQPIRLVRFN